MKKIVRSKIFFGNKYEDYRGKLYYNNDFDASEVKRIYFMQNADLSIERAWKGHKIEQRWFSVAQGKFLIKLIEIDNWEQPSKNLPSIDFELNSECLDILHIPGGYISYIRALEENSKLLVMADYNFGEINDEYRFPADYFEN